MWCFGSVVPFVLGAFVGGASEKILPAVGTAIGVVLTPILKAGRSIADAATAEMNKTTNEIKKTRTSED